MSTLFTKIINREIPSKIEYEDDDLVVIHDVHPKAPVHLLIIPKKEIETVNDFTESHAGLISKMILIAPKLAEQFDVDGYKLQFNVGEAGGQEIMHVHLHFLGYK